MIHDVTPPPNAIRPAVRCGAIFAAAAAACVLTLSACASGSLNGTHTCPPAGGQGCAFGQIYMLVAEHNGGTVSLFPQLPYNGTPRTTFAAPGAESFAWSLPTDTARTLYVGESPNTIAVFADGSTTVSGTITADIDDPAALQMGAAINPATKTLDESLFVANRGAGNVTIFDLADTSAPALTIPGLNAPDGLAFDAHQNLWVSEGHDLVEFTRPFSAASVPATRITAGLQSPSGIAFDQSGTTMYVTDAAQNAVVVYSLGSTTPSAVAKNGLSQPVAPYVIGDSESGAIFIPNRLGNSVAEYQLPLTAASVPAAIESSAMSAPSAVTFGFYPF